MDGHNLEEDDLFSEEQMSSGDGLHDNGIEIDKISDKLAFETIEEADLFYNTYGTRMGFNVRKCHKGYDKQKSIVKNAIWECSKAGFRRIRKTPLIRKPKPQTRVGCQACFYVTLQDGLYKVTKFVSEHNHDLLSPTSNKLKSNRFISPGDKAVMTIMSDAGHRTCYILDYLKLAYGGTSNMSFNNKDVYNFLNKKRNDLVRHGDASTALNLLDGVKVRDKNFIYDMTSDENNSLSRLFWTDGFSCAQYKLFGDAIVLDSTYKTNTYRFPLVLISGVDNNFKTCVFGAALMYSETTESYIWLFQKFLEAMEGKTPVKIMSDQDLAMRNAISEVSPTAKHRLCSWHLLRNCMQNVKNPGFCRSLGELIKKKYL